MHVVVRTYAGKGASEIFDLLERSEEEVKEIIAGVPGFLSYMAIRSREGGMTVTVCQDKAGTDESSRRAGQWVKQRVATAPNPPGIAEGSTVLQFSSWFSS